jgi:hypothetical protein
MDDEASLLPRKLQSALELALEQRNDIINQDSDSESDEGERGTHRHSLLNQMLRVCIRTTEHWPCFNLVNKNMYSTCLGAIYCLWSDENSWNGWFTSLNWLLVFRMLCSFNVTYKYTISDNSCVIPTNVIGPTWFSSTILKHVVCIASF